MKIRWLGSFGAERKTHSLSRSLTFELSGAGGLEVACENIKDNKSLINQSTIGLLVANSAIIKTFQSDVWSVKNDDGSLKATRRGCYSFNNTAEHFGHTECFAAADYKAIIVKRPLNTFSKKIQKTLKYFATKNMLPILQLKKGGLKKIF